MELDGLGTDTVHFLVMIMTSLMLFMVVVLLVTGSAMFTQRRITILWLGLVVVVGGMLFGRYGAQWGLPWWIYYPVPMLATVLLPPLLLKMNRQKTVIYLILSFLSAPLIHVAFSLLLGWNEYMPFWRI